MVACSFNSLTLLWHNYAYIRIKTVRVDSALAVCTPLCPHLFFHSPFQPSVSFLPLKVLSTKYPQWEAGRLFNTLHHSQKVCATDIVRGSIVAPLTHLSSFSFPLYSLFLFCSIRGWLLPLITAARQPGWAASSLLWVFCCCLRACHPLYHPSYTSCNVWTSNLLRQLGLSLAAHPVNYNTSASC